MSGLILGGRVVPVPGVQCVSWLDDPARCPQATDFYRWPRRPCRPLTDAERARRQPPPWIRGIVLHTVHGKDPRRSGGTLRPGLSGPSQRDLWYAQYQARTVREVSWDLTVDTDGTVAVSNDPLEHATWHAGSVNPITLGIELVQESDGSLYEGQMAVLVSVLDVLTRELRIQRQIPWRDGAPLPNVLARLRPAGGAGHSIVGIYGHRNQTENRGFGDPTHWPFEALKAAGYEGFDLAADDDREAWRGRQRALGFQGTDLDGLPGPGTVTALERRGHPYGLWVRRPGD